MSELTREQIEAAVGVISFDDVRLTAGEGKLRGSDVLMAVNAILAARGRALILAAKSNLPGNVGEDHGSGGAGWRPIADAPRDGTLILVARDSVWSEDVHAVVRWAEYLDRDNESWWQIHDGKNDHGLRGGGPSHWMPLPPAPDAAAPTAPPPPDGRVEEQTDSPVASRLYAATPSRVSESGCEPSTPHVFLDCDGVLADFDAHGMAYFGKPPRQAEAELGSKEFWRQLEARGDFYRSMPVMAGAYELFEGVKHLHPTILTGCPKGNWAQGQKVEWAAEHFPGVPIITCRSADKRDYAKPGDVLIDDWPQHRHRWIEMGGHFIVHIDAASSLAALWAHYPSLKPVEGSQTPSRASAEGGAKAEATGLKDSTPKDSANG